MHGAAPARDPPTLRVVVEEKTVGVTMESVVVEEKTVGVSMESVVVEASTVRVAEGALPGARSGRSR